MESFLVGPGVMALFVMFLFYCIVIFSTSGGWVGKRSVQGVVVDEHMLHIKVSSGTSGTRSVEDQSTQEAQRAVKEKRTKLMVRNVPFQADKKELKELFRFVILFFPSCCDSWICGS